MKRAVLAGIAIGLLTGCGGAQRGPTIAPRMQITFDSGDGQYIRYQVKPQGTLRFSGGQDVINDTWSWTGAVTPAQGAQLQQIVQRAGWIAAAPTGDGATEPVWRVSVRTDQGSRSFEVHGNTPSVTAAFDVLKNAGQSRLDADLNRTRRAGLDVLTERRNAEAAARHRDQ